MQRDANRLRTLRMRGSNPFACLICYLTAFALPALWEYAALALIYPRKLAFSAPDVAAQLIKAFPSLETRLSPVDLLSADSPFSLKELLLVREENWLAALALSAAAAWLLTLLVQLCWRFTHRSPLFSARRTAGAILSYRLMMLGVWLLNAAIAAGVWLFGVRFITGRTLWDYLVCFGIFPILPFCAMFVSRLAASSAISGRHAFFKRI